MVSTQQTRFTIDDALIVFSTPYKLLYTHRNKSLAIDVAVHPMLDGTLNALIYFPLRPHWMTQPEPAAISAEESDVITDRIETALTQKGFKVRFCLPMGAPA